MVFQDKELTCQDCEQTFTWSAKEQEFFAQKGFENVPKRCPECRKKRRQGRDGSPSTPRTNHYEINCRKCGKKDFVSFQPRNPETILCEECFNQEKQSQK